LEEGELGVDFDGRKFTYGFGELEELVFALRDDNPQEPRLGIPAVVIPLTTQHYPMLQRNPVYTGVTRVK
jgi:exodeoxyribonuclease V alpha subunit